MSRILSSHDTTFLMQSNVIPRPATHVSVFSGHLLQPVDLQVSPLRNREPDWVLATLVFCFILLAWGQFFYHKRIQQIFKAPFSRRFINQLTRDGNLFRERIAVALGFIYLLTFALLIYELNEQVVNLHFAGLCGISLYGAITLITVGALTAKVTLIRFLGVIFKTRETTYNYLLNMLIFALLSGPVYLLVLVCLVYLDSAVILHLCMILCMILIVFRLIRGFFIGMALRKFPYLFLFVYLCSLEILPLLVLIKILLNITQSAGA